LAVSSATQAKTQCEAERLVPGLKIVVDVIFGDEERLLRWSEVSALRDQPRPVAFMQNVDFKSFYDQTLWPRTFTLGLFKIRHLPSGTLMSKDSGIAAVAAMAAEPDLIPALLLVGLDDGESSHDPAIAAFADSFAQALAPAPEFVDEWTFQGCRITRLRSGLSPGLTIAFLSNGATNRDKAYCFASAHLAAGGVSGLANVGPDELLTQLRDGRYVFYGGRSFVYSIYDAVAYLEHLAGSTRCEFALLQMRKAYWLSQIFKRRYAHLSDDLL